VPHLPGAFSERISRSADDTVLTVISVVVVAVTSAVGVAAVYALTHFMS
jgi:hypothetical protein